MKIKKCYFEYDVRGIYITPLIGYSNIKGQKSFWIGWLWWLFKIEVDN